MLTLKRFAALAVVLWCAASPARAVTANEYVKAMNSWVGEEAQTLIGQWGKPLAVDKISEEAYEITYKASTPYYHSAVPATYARQCQGGGCGSWYVSDYGHDAYYSYTQCHTVFEVDDGVIVKWRWKGDCKN